MMTKEAMKLALEALDGLYMPGELDRANKAITALREALASEAIEQPALRVVDCQATGVCVQSGLRAEQPAQQEPVGWMCEDYDKHGTLQSKCIAMNPQRADPDNPLRVVKPLVFANSSPQAQRKPLTDDPLQGAVDWLLEADGEYFCTATVQRTLRIGYNRAKRLCDTAKERANQGIKGDT